VVFRDSLNRRPKLGGERTGSPLRFLGGEHEEQVSVSLHAPRAES
jgi:hypothetical protein